MAEWGGTCSQSQRLGIRFCASTICFYYTGCLVWNDVGIEGAGHGTGTCDHFIHYYAIVKSVMFFKLQ